MWTRWMSSIAMDIVDTVDVYSVDSMDVDMMERVDVSPTRAEVPGSKRNTEILTGLRGAYEVLSQLPSRRSQSFRCLLCVMEVTKTIRKVAVRKVAA
jgi:hypothetical protein